MRKTLFVVGAGASRELNLPDGNALGQIIAQKLNVAFDTSRPFSGRDLASGDIAIVEAMRARERDIGELVRAARTISQGVRLSLSIDNFLENHRHDERILAVGKMAIVRSILEAEAGSRLFFDKRRDRPSFDDNEVGVTWLYRFFKILSEHRRKDDIDRLFDGAGFIVFNYDRCIEFFLVEATRRAYAVSEAEAHRLVSTLQIIHPYGTVGSLPGQEGSGHVPFGGGEHLPSLGKLAEGIRIYTEEMNDRAALDRMNSLVASADTIVFLGFAYHPQNMRLLGAVPGGPPKTVLGTALGISEPDQAVVRDQISGIFSSPKGLNIHLRTLTCAALFDEYWRTLAVRTR